MQTIIVKSSFGPANPGEVTIFAGQADLFVVFFPQFYVSYTKRINASPAPPLRYNRFGE